MIRRALAALALLFAPAAYASVTLTVSPTGSTTPTGAYVRMDIANCTNPTVVNSNTKIPVSRQFKLNGAASVTLTVEDNVTQIACNGNQLSYYTVTYVANGTQTQLKSVELPPGIFALENLAAVYYPPWSPGVLQGPLGPVGPQGPPGINGCILGQSECVNFTNPSVSGYMIRSYGDSITAGHGLSGSSPDAPPGSPQAYPALIGKDITLYTDNRGYSSAQCADVFQRVANDYAQLSDGVLRSLQIGTNDASSGDAYLANVYAPCHKALVAWLGTPGFYTKNADSAVTTGSAAIIPNAIAGVDSLCRTSAQNDTCSITINRTDLGPVYLWYLAQDSNGGVCQYTLDGASSGTYTTAPATPINTQLGGHTTIFLQRFSSVASGSHTVSIKQASTAPFCGLLSVGAPPSTSIAGKPVVAVGDIPLTNGHIPLPEQTVNYIAAIQANVALFASDGLDIRFVNTHNYMFGTAAEMQSDNLHPNSFGQVELSHAYENAFQAVYGPNPNVNPMNLLNTSSLNPVAAVFSGSEGNVFGSTLTFNGSSFDVSTIFPSTAIGGSAPSGYAIYHYTPPLTSQTQLVRDMYVTSTDINAFHRLKVFASAPANPLAGYTQDNANNLQSTTALNPGHCLYSSPTASFCQDLGYDTTLSKYVYRTFIPSDAVIENCSHTAGGLPTSQASLSCFDILYPNGKRAFLSAITSRPAPSSTDACSPGETWTANAAGTVYTYFCIASGNIVRSTAFTAF